MKWLFGSPLELETENFILKSIDAEKFPEVIVNWFSDPETMKFMNDPMNLTRQQLSQYFSAYNNKEKIALLITDKKTQKPIGIFRIYLEHHSALGMTSILIGDKDFWGQNVVLEVRERAILFLFTGVKLNKICGYVRARNFPALFNYTRQKFVKEGIRKQQIRNHSGQLDDVIEFALFKEAWAKDRQERKS